MYAAAAGARDSLSVDLSNRYLDWAAENFKLNGLDPSRIVWSAPTAASGCEARSDASGAPFDLIFLDPPTFSNSKRMQGVLDIQRDHPELIDGCMQLLTPGGVLLFSTNAQRFRLEPRVAAQWQVTDISKQTLPFDFERNPHIHHCFEISRR